MPYVTIQPNLSPEYSEHDEIAFAQYMDAIIQLKSTERQCRDSANSWKDTNAEIYENVIGFKLSTFSLNIFLKKKHISVHKLSSAGSTNVHVFGADTSFMLCGLAQRIRAWHRNTFGIYVCWPWGRIWWTLVFVSLALLNRCTNCYDIFWYRICSCVLRCWEERIYWDLVVSL